MTRASRPPGRETRGGPQLATRDRPHTPDPHPPEREAAPSRLPRRGDIDALLSVIDPAAEVAYRRQLGREAWRDGYTRGYRDGYERGARFLEATWPAIAAPVLDSRPDHAELLRRRWGPGGRAHFGDYRGPDGAA
jgi:hypothetical protein